MPRLMRRHLTLHEMLDHCATPEERAAIQARLDNSESASDDSRYHLGDGVIIDGKDTGVTERAHRRALVAAAQERERRAR